MINDISRKRFYQNKTILQEDDDDCEQVASTSFSFSILATFEKIEKKNCFSPIN